MEIDYPNTVQNHSRENLYYFKTLQSIFAARENIGVGNVSYYDLSSIRDAAHKGGADF